jgi:phosphoglycolate phosphatase-like HAD superfamily hydrolase
MARSNIRVLALDLDGTLTNDEKIVTPRTRAALDAAAAQGVKDLFDLKLIQYTLPQLQRALRQVLQRELPTRQCNKNTTACPEPKFMDLRCRLCWQLSQWPGQP